jgi:ribonuclease P protein component
VSNEFPTKCRLKTKGQFKIVFTKGKKVLSNWFAIFYYKNGLDYSRIGIVATKKNLPSAVMRNKFKRIVRESFRLAAKNRAEGVDIVVFAYKKAANLSTDDLRKWLDQYLGKFI